MWKGCCCSSGRVGVSKLVEGRNSGKPGVYLGMGVVQVEVLQLGWQGEWLEECRRAGGKRQEHVSSANAQIRLSVICS